jgi:hypothetical protein
MIRKWSVLLAVTLFVGVIGCSSQAAMVPPASAGRSSVEGATQPSAKSPAPSNSQSADRFEPESPARVKDIEIEQALFGSGTHLADVTGRVVELLRTEPKGFTAREDWLHIDPAPRKNKSLLIWYRYKGKERMYVITGGVRASYADLTAEK